MNEKIAELLKEIGELEEIERSDIPMLDLYMDQVITLFENKLEKGKRKPEDKLLTKTMINNYVKDKILMPAKNKRYTPEHLVMMALIYNLKQTLSINDIKILFTETVYKEEVDLFELYDQFLEIKKQDHIHVAEIIGEKLKGLDSNQSQQMDIMMMVLSLVNSANIQTRLAEKLIDDYLTKGEKDEK